MNKKIMLRKLNALLIGSSMLAVPALYSGDDARPTAHDEQMMENQNQSLASQQSQLNERQLDQLIGASVQDPDGDRLGAISDLIVDTQSSKAKFAIIETDNWFDDRRAIIPVEKLRTQGQTSGDSEPQLSLDLKEDRFDQLAGVELDRRDLTGSIEEALDSINETFDVQIDRSEIADTDFRLASDLSDMAAAEGQGFTSIDHIVVDFENGGEYQYIVSDAAGTSYRVPGRDVRFADREHIALSAPGAINSYPVYMTPATVQVDRTRMSSNDQSSQRDAERFDRDSSASDAHSTGGSMDNRDSSGSYASSDRQSSTAGGDKADDPDRVYSSNGLVSEDEESRTARRGDSQSSSSDRSSMASNDRDSSSDEWASDEESYSAKQQWDRSASGGLSNISEPERILGLSVLDRNGDRVGEISDALVSSEDGQMVYAIVESDDWFDGRAAIVPVQSLDADHEEENASADYIEHVSLAVSEDEFENLATFSKDQDITQFLSDNRSSIVSTFKVDENQLPSTSAGLVRASERNER